MVSQEMIDRIGCSDASIARRRFVTILNVHGMYVEDGNESATKRDDADQQPEVFPEN